MSRHLELETLSALLDAELDGAEAATARTHVAECPECRARLDGLRSTVNQLRSLPPAAPPPHVREALRRQLAMEQAVRRRLWTLPGWHSRLAAWPAMAAAVFLAFGCGLFLYAYLVRHPALVRPATPAAPVAKESEWRATITYEPPPEDTAPSVTGAEAPPPPAAAAPAAKPQALAAATENRVAPSPPPPQIAARERSEREPAVAGTSARPLPERDALQVAAEAAPGPGASPTEGVAAGAVAAPAPAAGLAARKAAPAMAEQEVVGLGPGVQPPVRIAGENPDLRALADVGLRQPLVIVEGVVGTDGLLRDLSLRPPDLDPRLAAAVRRSLATWRFQPATKQGRPVAVRYVVTLNIDSR